VKKFIAVFWVAFKPKPVTDNIAVSGASLRSSL